MVPQYRVRQHGGLAGLTVALCLSVARLGAQFPTPSGAVNDFAGVLTADEERGLTALVQEVEDASSGQGQRRAHPGGPDRA